MGNTGKGKNRFETKIKTNVDKDRRNSRKN